MPATEEPEDIANNIYELMDNYQAHLYLSNKGFKFADAVKLIDVYHEYQKERRGKWGDNT